MALNTDIVGGHGIHPAWIDDIAARGMLNVVTSGAMTAFATDIPFRNLLCMDVIADGMTAVAGRPGGSLHVVGRIKLRPPVSPGRWHMIRQPLMRADVPLHRQRKIIVANFGEVALLPNAAVNERNLIHGKL